MLLLPSFTNEDMEAQRGLVASHIHGLKPSARQASLLPVPKRACSFPPAAVHTLCHWHISPCSSPSGATQAHKGWGGGTGEEESREESKVSHKTKGGEAGTQEARPASPPGRWVSFSPGACWRGQTLRVSQSTESHRLCVFPGQSPVSLRPTFLPPGRSGLWMLSETSAPLTLFS